MRLPMQSVLSSTSSIAAVWVAAAIENGNPLKLADVSVLCAMSKD